MGAKQVVLTRKAAMTMGALHGFLKPRLAQDAKLDLSGILARVTSKNFAASKPLIVKGVTKALEGKLAKDASVEGLATLLDALEEEKGGMDDPLPLETEPNAGLPLEVKEGDQGPDHAKHEAIKEFLRGKLSPEDMAEVESMIGAETADEALGTKTASIKGEDEFPEKEEEKEKKKEGAKDQDPPPFKGKPETGGGMVTKDAMNKAITIAQENARKEAARVRDAERFVRPWVGDMVIANDSAEEVYKTALTALNVDVKGVHPSAYKAILERIPLPGKQKQESSFGMDSSSISDFAKRYPEAARIKFA